MRSNPVRRLALAAAAAVFLFHLGANPHYGFFRDELYFIVCGRHPALGYVDQPPLIPLLAAASQAFGISLVALRAVSAFFGAAAVYVAVLLVEQLNGGRFAAALAAIATALSPEVAAFGVLVGPDCVTIVAWPLLALLVLRLAGGGSPRLWLWAGVTAGLALEGKYSVALWIVSLFLALLATPERRLLQTRWFVVGALVATAVAAPSIVWQALQHFPMKEVLDAGQRGKNVTLSPLQYLAQQVLITNPVLSVIWIAGLAWVVAHVRWFGLTSVLTLGLVIMLHGKDYYACGIFPGLFAAGAVALESWTARLRPVIIATAAAAGLLLIPTVVPVLDERAFVAYESALHLRPTPSEHHKQAALPQHYADMHGWPELTATIARIAETLTPQERARTIVFSRNYGEASAINFFGRGLLPPAVSGHNQYFLWGAAERRRHRHRHRWRLRRASARLRGVAPRHRFHRFMGTAVRGRAADPPLPRTPRAAFVPVAAHEALRLTAEILMAAVGIQCGGVAHRHRA